MVHLSFSLVVRVCRAVAGSRYNNMLSYQCTRLSSTRPYQWRFLQPMLGLSEPAQAGDLRWIVDGTGSFGQTSESSAVLARPITTIGTNAADCLAAQNTAAASFTHTMQGNSACIEQSRSFAIAHLIFLTRDLSIQTAPVSCTAGSGPI